MFVIMTTCKRSERPEQPFLGQAEGGKDRRYGVQGLEKKGSRDQFTSVFFYRVIGWLCVRYSGFSLAITFLMPISWLLNISYLTRSDQIEPWAWFFLRFRLQI